MTQKTPKGPYAPILENFYKRRKECAELADLKELTVDFKKKFLENFEYALMNLNQHDKLHAAAVVVHWAKDSNVAKSSLLCIRVIAQDETVLLKHEYVARKYKWIDRYPKIDPLNLLMEDEVFGKGWKLTEGGYYYFALAPLDEV